MWSNRTVIGIGSVALLAAWIAAASSDRPSAPPPPIVPIDAEASSLDGLRDQTERLRDHLRRMPSPVRPARNPFRFADRTAVAARPTRRGGGAEVQSAPPPGLAGLRLIGIAETRRGDAVVRTAILSVDGQTCLVVVGDTIAALGVRAISGEAVEFVRASDGGVVTLVLN